MCSQASLGRCPTEPDIAQINSGQIGWPKQNSLGQVEASLFEKLAFANLVGTLGKPPLLFLCMYFTRKNMKDMLSSAVWPLV